MTQLNSDYKPVSCDLSDELEDLSLKKRRVQLKINSANGGTDWKVGFIQDLFTKDHADFVKLSDGTIIRLDKIIEWRQAG